MMPVIFIGHGSPMNAIEENEFTEAWSKIARAIPRPEAILSISAHWFTEKTRINTEENPKNINDFYGFPRELYDVGYIVKGSPDIAKKTKDLIGDSVIEDNTWGIDHGTWSILNRMYPDADIPVYQISIDSSSKPKDLYEIGKKLKALRKENILILGSGNVVHNLRHVDFSVNGGYDWAEEFDSHIKESIEKRDFDSVINYSDMGKSAEYSVPTPEHFYPLLYILGAVNDSDKVEVYNNSCIAGSLSMTSYLFS